MNYFKGLSSSNTVKCKDGSKKFNKSQFNDDFCDCPDGSDEPGILLLASISVLIRPFFMNYIIINFLVPLIANLEISLCYRFKVLSLDWISGTSACPNGRFYCKNAGHTPLFLYSSRVNDGICGNHTLLSHLSWTYGLICFKILKNNERIE